MIIQFIAWTCAILFASTGLLTVLSIINIINIQENYRNKLFYTCLIEIIGISIWGFNMYLQDYSHTNKWNFITITTPDFINKSTDTLYTKGNYSTFLINGVAQFDKDKGYHVELSLTQNGNSTFTEKLNINDNGIFNYSLEKSKFINKSNFSLVARIVDNNNSTVKSKELKGIIKND